MPRDYLDAISMYNVRQAWPNVEVTALLVIDMQHYFDALAQPILGNILSLTALCRTKGVPIAFTRHGHRDPTHDGGMLRTWWGDLIHVGSRDWALIEKLAPKPTEWIIDKNRYSAFYDTDLDTRLRDAGVKDLIITGVMTNCCCETTARDAFVRDYRIFFVTDATASANEELHLASLKNLAYGFAYMVSTQDLCGYLKGTKAG